MATTKAKAIDQLSGPNSISHQEALVKKIQGTKVNKPVKFAIPGGKTLTNDISQTELSSAIYNWLRRCRHFTEGVVSLCSADTSLETKEVKAIDFDTKNKNSEWEVRGKRWLSERIADVISEDDVIAIKIQKDGLYKVTDTTGDFTPESEDWEPYVELIPFRSPTF